MKKILLVLVVSMLSILSYAQRQNINLVDFEAAGGYTTSVAEFTDGSEDYFTRTDGSNIATAMNFTNTQGSFFFGVHDTNGDGGPTTVSLSVTGISIAGFTDLELSLFVAEDDDASNQDWDGDTSMSVEYSIDGGATQEIFRVEATGGTNTEPAEDTDFNGTGDGTTITDAFAQFVKTIGMTGNTMDITITFRNLEAGDEDIAIDNILVTGIPDAPAPVNLVSFSAKPMKKAVSLEWATASEENNAYFSIEHSTDGQNFTAIDEVEGALNANFMNYYEYMHEDAAKGMNYYRLRQVDTDGTFSLSDVQAVKISGVVGIKARPTLADKNVTIDIESALNAETTVEVFNILGRIVAAEVLPVGATQLVIDVNGLRKGHYFVRLNNGSNSRTARFIRK